MSTIEQAMSKLNNEKKLNKSIQNVGKKEKIAVKQSVTHEKVIDNKVLLIDEQHLQNLGMVGGELNHQNKKINDEYRAIKHKIVNNAFGPLSKINTNSNLIMVSSANPNEGKTFNAINLALSLSLEKDKSVLLVDADVLNPSVSKTLNIGKMPGLIDYLVSDDLDAGEVIYNTSNPNLRLMPAGTSHHLSYELLASDKMFTLAQELANRYSDRIVIFDCPPLLGVIETISLSKLVGQIVVVVEQEKTKIADIKQAVAQLDKEIAIGFIVNKAVHKVFGQYGYGYGYGYGEKNQ
ncbi:AAA family ATPase [Photobacterium sp. BZF1]|uniref:XrtA-associated tyrosine autokinase n=1 Tax=Photobacterium sp. BZF1 TaxID=1904457 RepID=UPI001653D913|nr:XrtA-associated tyrosine autokinase [Photobacterium sp. BZF1]MBC7004732.1 AAA family ATPase [Photobacterium sp. BZF1]